MTFLEKQPHTLEEGNPNQTALGQGCIVIGTEVHLLPRPLLLWGLAVPGPASTCCALTTDRSGLAVDSRCSTTSCVPVLSHDSAD